MALIAFICFICIPILEMAAWSLSPEGDWKVQSGFALKFVLLCVSELSSINGLLVITDYGPKYSADIQGFGMGSEMTPPKASLASHTYGISPRRDIQLCPCQYMAIDGHQFGGWRPDSVHQFTPLLRHSHYTSACTSRQLCYDGHVDWHAQPSHITRQTLQELDIGGGEAWTTLNGKAIETWLEWQTATSDIRPE
jgi:hypothetical protein